MIYFTVYDICLSCKVYDICHTYIIMFMKITRDSDCVGYHLLVSEVDLGIEWAWKEGEKLSKRKMMVKIELQTKVKLILGQVFQNRLTFQPSKYKMDIKKEYLEATWNRMKIIFLQDPMELFVVRTIEKGHLDRMANGKGLRWKNMDIGKWLVQKKWINILYGFWCPLLPEGPKDVAF